MIFLHVTPWKWQSQNLTHTLQVSHPIGTRVRHSTLSPPPSENPVGNTEYGQQQVANY